MDNEQLKRHLEAVGLEVDEERLAALAPIYTGLLSGARRIAAADLGEREPSTTFRHPLAPGEGGR